MQKIFYRGDKIIKLTQILGVIGIFHMNSVHICQKMLGCRYSNLPNNRVGPFNRVGGINQKLLNV